MNVMRRNPSERERTAAGAAQVPSTAWAAYAACAWAVVFAAASFYWAAGGTAGSGTVAKMYTASAVAHDAGLAAQLWIAGVLKLLIGVLALALVQRWGRRFPRWMPLAAGWAAGVLLSLYGVADLIDHALMAIGAINTPASLGASAVRWHLLLWDPWWLLGGILFVVAVWGFGRVSRVSSP